MKLKFVYDKIQNFTTRLEIGQERKTKGQLTWKTARNMYHLGIWVKTNVTKRLFFHRFNNPKSTKIFKSNRITLNDGTSHKKKRTNQMRKEIFDPQNQLFTINRPITCTKS